MMDSRDLDDATGEIAGGPAPAEREETTLADVVARIRDGTFYGDYDWACGPALRALESALQREESTGKAGGFCPECGAGNYGGPLERRRQHQFGDGPGGQG